ncbi:MAG: DUF1564 family protein [Leptospiraceae bacterium]|nr:DUF1564 family protein [Leptospiraceae bacterium]
MKTFYNPIHTSVCENIHEIQSSSTLLIPKRLKEQFDEKIKLHKSKSNYLHYLLERYSFLIYNQLLQPNSKIKTQYQERFQDLQKVGFRPLNEDWIHLKVLKNYLNQTICFIFVCLLLIDLKDIFTDIPEKIQKFIFPSLGKFKIAANTILSRKNFLFRRVLKYRRDKKKMNFKHIKIF